MFTALLTLSLAGSFPTEAQLKVEMAKFAPTDIKANLKDLPASEHTALAALVRAAKRLDALFLEQAWGGNPNLLVQLSKDQSPLGRARLHFFLINKGPWNRLSSEAFLPDVPAKPAPEAAFYPSDAQEEIQKLIQTSEGDQKKQVTSFYTVARRDPSGALIWIPYSEVYGPELALVAADLRSAAKATQDPGLRKFLESRAKAFTTNEYRESDSDWMDLSSAIEPTLGPYEVYEDGWFNLKAAFEAFITIDSPAENILPQLSSKLQDLEDKLPIDHEYRNPKLGTTSPIKVVDEVYASGDANHGVQTAAFDLPNDEVITREKGTKRVMLKNVQDAKFNKILLPISRIVLTPKAQKAVSFDAFFTHILMHELMHGLGPHESPPGSQKPVREALGNDYSMFEEAKADISGLWAMQQLVDKGVLPKELESSMYVTFLASAMRTLRFGLNEAHGKGQAIQLNYLLDKGGFIVKSGCRFDVDPAKIKDAVRDLTHDIMMLQAEGDRGKAEALLGTLGIVRPETKCALDKLSKIPVDIEPRFVTADQLLAE